MMEKCPLCNERAMPLWSVDGSETGRACQSCGLVEARDDGQSPSGGYGEFGSGGGGGSSSNGLDITTSTIQ